ncbi:MAG: hypothetical protein U5L01_06520 [Rheinheimera sp.]|nr:hypothetical protein [Rheinheimera sp.]
MDALLEAANGDGEELQQIYSAFTSVAHSLLLTIALVEWSCAWCWHESSDGL